MNRNSISPEAKEKANKRIAENLLLPAFKNAADTSGNVNGKSPWNPSVSSTSRVKGNVKAPEFCPCCGVGKVTCVPHSKIYGGRSFGDWPWALACDNCDATVGLHPFTNIPLGTLATKKLRDLRMQAKNAFNPLWQTGNMNRTQAYEWLATAMGLSSDDAHIGMMNEEQCKKCIEVSESMYFD